MRALLAKYDRFVVAATAALVVLGGIVRAFSYKGGSYILVATVLLYIAYRIYYYYIVLKHKNPMNSRDKQHLVTFIIILSISLLSFFDLLRADFILLFALLIDYVISINPIKQKQISNE